MTQHSENYSELKARQQKEINAFPMAFAFSDNQLQEALKKLNSEKSDVLSIGGGGIIRKSDRAGFSELFQRHMSEQESNLDNEEYLYSMFLYELANHEYCITYDLEPTLSACGITPDQVEDSEVIKAALKRARNDYMSSYS